jgi:threonine dehydrogenase-like Zn-dependent dehydrogenase
MEKVEHTVVVERSPDDVFAYLTEPANLPEWQTSVLEAKSDGPLRAGATLTELRKFLGVRIESTLEVTEYEPNRRFAFRVVSGPVPFRVDHAFEATGRTDAMRAAFLSTRPRGQAVLMGIPGDEDELRVPARSIPRMERRVIGALYGSSRPERDFPLILDAYRRGRLPLDRLISHRLPLERIGDGFELLRAGEARRSVIELVPADGTPA